MDLRALAPGQKVAIGGAVLAIVGAVLPWIASGSGSIAGFEAEGFLTLMAALTVLGITTLWEWRRVQMASVALFGAIITAIAVSFLFSFGEIAGVAAGAVDPGVGVYVTVVAGVLVGGSGVYGLVGRRRALQEVNAEEGEGGSRGEPPLNE